MTTHNPYVAPRASVDDAEEYQPLRVWSVSGRIGRARYILYSMGLPLAIMFLTGALSAFLGQAGAVLIPAGWIAVGVISFMLTVQRCHDFGITGWLALACLIPLLNLVFWFVPGTEGANRFGARTPPNSTGVLIALWIMPAIFAAGIVAAVYLKTEFGL